MLGLGIPALGKERKQEQTVVRVSQSRQDRQTMLRTLYYSVQALS